MLEDLLVACWSGLRSLRDIALQSNRWPEVDRPGADRPGADRPGADRVARPSIFSLPRSGLCFCSTAVVSKVSTRPLRSPDTALPARTPTKSHRAQTPRRVRR